MDWIFGMQKALDDIERQLDGEIDFARAAGMAARRPPGYVITARSSSRASISHLCGCRIMPFSTA